MSDNRINTLCRIDQSIRGLNEDAHDDSYIPAQSENGALERINKSIQNLDIKGIKSGLPKVTNADNGKVLQVKNGKWGKGDEKLVHISSVSFLDDFHKLSENDTLYLVSGEIEEDARLNESIESEAASEGIVSYYPTVIPPEENHEPWRAFHDDDEYNGWTSRYANEGASAHIQYNFQNDFGVALSGIEFNTTYTYIGEEPAPEELPKIHLELELQVCDDSIHHNWVTIWTYDREVNDDGWFGTRVISTDHIYAVRLICKNRIYDEYDGAMVTIGNFKFVGMVQNDGSESREIWYKGHKFGNVGEGGGSGGPTRTVLFEAPDGGGVWMDSAGKYLDLSDDIDNYDEIEVIALTTEGDNNLYYAGSQKFAVADLLVPRKDTANKGMPFRVLVYRSTGLDTAALSVILVSQAQAETVKRTLYCNGATGVYGVAIHKVIGIKY